MEKMKLLLYHKLDNSLSDFEFEKLKISIGNKIEFDDIIVYNIFVKNNINKNEFEIIFNSSTNEFNDEKLNNLKDKIYDESDIFDTIKEKTLDKTAEKIKNIFKKY